MSTPAAADPATRLERLIARDGGRGIGPLAEAAAGGLPRAAHALGGARAVTILTGFYIPSAQPPGAETDGPIGAAFLATALTARGAHVHMVTDAPCAPVVVAALDAAGLSGAVAMTTIAVEGFAGGAPLEVVVNDHAAAPPSHVVAIERCGPAAGGVPRNLRGEDIAAHTARLEQLFVPPAFRIGIGDGGNELGMGSLPPGLVARHIRHGATVACHTPADALVVAGVSNWGGAALALLVGGAGVADRIDGAAHDRLLDAIVAAGAVDGIRRTATRSVDDLDGDVHRDVLDALVRELRG